MKIISDDEVFEREFDRLSKMPDAKMTAGLDAAFAAAYGQAEAQVHVRTGSLKASGKSETRSEEHTWDGEFSFGGPSTGINNPVDYAIYEKARGGAHDFLGNLQLAETLHVEAIKEGLTP